MLSKVILGSATALAIGAFALSGQSAPANAGGVDITVGVPGLYIGPSDHGRKHYRKKYREHRVYDDQPYRTSERSTVCKTRTNEWGETTKVCKTTY